MLVTSFIKPRNARANKPMGQKVVPLGAFCDTLTLQIQASERKETPELCYRVQYPGLQK